MIPVEKLLVSHVKTGSKQKQKRHIVVLKHDDAYDRCLKKLAKFGLKPLKAVRGSLLICCHAKSSSAWDALRKHPDVAYTERDHKVKAHGLGIGRQSSRRRDARLSSASANYPRRAPWNVCRVKAPPVWTTTQGQGTRLAIIDTGIGRNPDLTIAGGVNTMGGKSYADDNGHGTHVAGIAAATGRKRIYGVAPRAQLFAVKALDALGEGFVSDIVEGLDWSIKNRMRVVNMSLGLSSGSKALREAVQRARRSGIVIAASAGNSGPDNSQIDAPARYRGVLAVAATTRRNRAASFSSRGRGIALSAPGVRILSTAPGGGYVRMTGTSMSSPHVAGGAVLLRALQPAAGATAIRRQLKANAIPLPGGTRAVGEGLLQVAPSALCSSNSGSKQTTDAAIVRKKQGREPKPARPFLVRQNP